MDPATSWSNDALNVDVLGCIDVQPSRRRAPIVVEIHANRLEDKKEQHSISLSGVFISRMLIQTCFSLFAHHNPP